MDRIVHIQSHEFDGKTLCELEMEGRVCSDRRYNCEDCKRVKLEKAQELQGV